MPRCRPLAAQRHAQFEDPYPLFFKTCFNHSCLTAFAEWSGIEIEGDSTAEKAEWILFNAPRQWEDWRVSVLVDWAREFREIVKEIRPNALLGNYQAAWKDEDFWGHVDAVWDWILMPSHHTSTSSRPCPTTAVPTCQLPM